jgi:hypothetical protein
MVKESLAERIIRAEPTEELVKLRNRLIDTFRAVPNAEQLVDRDYAILRDELNKRGAL